MRDLWATVRSWLREDKGQDLSDYCLITALVALIALGIFIHVSGGIHNLWNVGNATLVTGNSVAAGGNGGASGSSGSLH